MSITINDLYRGTEVNLGPSDVRPGLIRATIFGKTFDDVQLAIQDLADEYGHAEFTIPALCADGKYGAIGLLGTAR